MDASTLSFVSAEAGGTKLAFMLSAHDGTLLSVGSRVDVTVKASLDPVPEVSGGGCECHTSASPEGKLSALAIGALVIERRRRNLTAS